MKGGLSCRHVAACVTRRKPLDQDVLLTPLKRCLNYVDLTLLGIGHMLGAGIYVLTGTVMHSKAGPATVLSYLFSGTAVLLASLGYVEFGSKVPRAGSSFSYTYLVLGELAAFLVGWNIVLEHAISAAATARAWSGTVDNLAGGAISNGTLTYVGGLHLPLLSEYPDLVALGYVLVLMVVVVSGVRGSSTVLSLATALNMAIIMLIASLAFSVADFSRWSNPAAGGFMPHGFTGVLSGTATLFFAYVGFETVAVAGEEAKDPQKGIPFATFVGMALTCVLYMLMAMALSVMVDSTDIDVTAPFPAAFRQNGFQWAQYVVAVGTLLALTAATLAGLFVLPRAVYAMAVDGLFFSVFTRVSQATHVPIYATLVFGSLAGLLAMVFDLETLVELLSIGTLICLTMVSICVIVVRYSPVDNCPFRLKVQNEPEEKDDDDVADGQKKLLKTKHQQKPEDIGQLKPAFRSTPGLSRLGPGQGPHCATAALVLSTFCGTLILVQGWYYLANLYIWAVLLLTLCGVISVASFAVLLLYEHNTSLDGFQTPLVPLLPTLSIFINLTMIASLSHLTWTRLAVWVAIGLVVYFGYGIRHSALNNTGSIYTAHTDYGSNMLSMAKDSSDLKESDSNDR